MGDKPVVTAAVPVLSVGVPFDDGDESKWNAVYRFELFFYDGESEWMRLSVSTPATIE